MAKRKASGTGENVEYVPLEVTIGILVHIGAGIYHSVAGALKELVSNSYDADAKQVVISTGYPSFEQIRAVDTGIGMTSTRFKQAMRSIGSSLKGVLEPDRKTKKYDRPVIGQLGIGMMALSQICSEATIESQVEGSGTKFIAKLDFSEFKSRKKEDVKLDVFRERLEHYGDERQLRRLLKDSKTDPEKKIEIQEILDLLRTAGHKLESNVDGDKEHLGYCILYPDLPAIPGEHGTTITLNRIEQTVRDSLMDVGRAVDDLRKHFRNENLDWARYREEVNEWSWEQLCERLMLGTNGLTFQWLPKYHQFIWELSLMTPIKYLPSGPVTCKPKVLAPKKKELESFCFSLRVDNRLLSKPMLLPSGALGESELEEEYDYTLRPFNFDGVIDSERLRYDGYLFWQRKQIQPSTIRGLQIYLRNVGIGLYDDTLMNFSTVNPTSRAGQISGEIYVHEGLERALNVNRNSFRETDAHYVALQQDIWNMLGTTKRDDGVIGMSVSAYWARKDRSNEKLQKEHRVELRKLVSSISAGGIVLSFSSAENEKPYEVTDNRIVVYDGSPSWPRAVQERHTAQRVLVSARAALEVGFPPKQLVNLLEDLILRK